VREVRCRGHQRNEEPSSSTVMMTTDRDSDGDVRSSDQTSVEIGTLRETQLSSDPPTSLIRRDSFHELPPGSVVDDTYEIDARLGAGAMGEVYAARHMKLGKRVAIKVIGRQLSEDDAAIERFAMEARTLAQIQHPAIVAVEHVGELADGRAYFIMEFLRGESLFERLQRGRLPLPEALRVLDQMARGLDAAHGEGIVHRDVKPENTFLVHLPGEPPIVKIVDFGLSKLRVADNRAARTESGVAIGTPMYMSPEQMRGQGVDHRTDVYALGCVAYELVLGRPLFPRAQTAPELYAAHLHEVPPLPRSIWPEIPPQLDLVLFAMVAKDPAHRPTLEQVRAVIAGASISTSAKSAATEFVGHRIAKHRRRKLAIGAVVLIALVGGLTIGMNVGRRQNVVAPTGHPPGEDAAPPIATPVAPPVKPPITPPIETPVTADLKPAPPPRNTGSASRSRTERQPKPGNVNSVPAAQVDAGVDAAEPPPSPSPMIDKPVPKDKPVNPNQTINPFAKKRPKVNP
jgi:serine/threonine protein kinase